MLHHARFNNGCGAQIRLIKESTGQIVTESGWMHWTSSGSNSDVSAFFIAEITDLTSVYYFDYWAHITTCAFEGYSRHDGVDDSYMYATITWIGHIQP